MNDARRTRLYTMTDTRPVTPPRDKGGVPSHSCPTCSSPNADETQRMLCVIHRRRRGH